MTLKINRRVFILSTLGYVYYVKLDDGVVMKRLEVRVNGWYGNIGGVKNSDKLIGNDKSIRNVSSNKRENETMKKNNNKLGTK